MPMVFWNPKDDKELTGIYQGWINEMGKFKSRCYVFYDGVRRVHVWSNKRLTEILFGLPFKTKIKLTYLGKVQNPGDKYGTHDFSMEVLEDTAEVSNALDKSEQGEIDLTHEPIQGTEKSNSRVSRKEVKKPVKKKRQATKA